MTKVPKQWIGFYMVGASATKELILKFGFNTMGINFHHFLIWILSAVDSDQKAPVIISCLTEYRSSPQGGVLQKDVILEKFSKFIGEQL